MAYTFISGATGGIGKAFAEAFSGEQNQLFLTGRSEEKLNELKARLEKNGAKVIICACDLTDEKDIAKMISYIDQKTIKFDRIINVAGVDTQKAFSEYTLEKVLFQIKVNVLATTSLTHSLLKRREGKTEVITISSMSGQSPMPYFQIYSASKAYLTNLFTALSYEYDKKDVKFCTVLPGGVYTRPDVIKDIEGQGVWGKLSAFTPEKLVQKTLKAVKRNKRKYIPGFFNKLLNFLMKIAPKKIVLKFIAKRWKKINKDAFN